MSQNRIYLMSPAGSPVSSIAAAQQRSAQSRARIKATQAQSSQLAAQSLRQGAIASRASRQASHVLQLAIDPVEPSPRFEALQSRDRERRMANLRDRLGVPNVQMEIVDSRAILTGTVENERRKRLLERVLLLEPDIDAVDNRLAVLAP